MCVQALFMPPYGKSLKRLSSINNFENKNPNEKMS